MGKSSTWTNLCFYPFPLLDNVEKQRARGALSYVMGLQHCIAGEGEL